MARRITAKIEEYQKDGETKGKYIEIGVILENANGEYIMLNPTVDLSGVLMKQRLLAAETGKKAGGNVMCSIFDNDNQGSGAPAQQGTATPQSYHRDQQAAPAQQQSPAANDYGIDSIPF